MIKIIMCTYNGEKYLSQQLESIENNTFSDWELYVSDDGSSDKTLQILEEAKKKCANRIHIHVNEDRLGVTANFLRMIQIVKESMKNSDVIMLCDQDDVWYKQKIELTYNYMKKSISEYSNTMPLLVCSDVKVVDEKLSVISDSFKKMNHYNVKKLDFAHLVMENKVQGCTIMLNKALADKIYVLPKEATMHDGWLGLVASVLGKIGYISEPTMLYRQHAENVKGSSNFWRDVIRKIGHLSEQREMVFNTKGQIKELLDIYYQEMSLHDQKIARAFVTLDNQSCLLKRLNIIRYHMWKSGWLRNIGLLILI